MKRWGLIPAVMLVASLAFGVQEAASAASGRIVAPSIGMNAPIVKVGKSGTGLAIGGNPNVVYTWKHGDLPCDPVGSTVYAGHAWRAGDGVADRWGQLTKGRIITVNGCKFRVKKRQFLSAAKTKKRMKKYYRVDGPPRIVLIGCKANDYSKRTVVIAKKIS